MSRKGQDSPVTHDSDHSDDSHKPLIGGGKVLSEREAEELLEPLTAALSDGWNYLDKLLWLRCPHLEQRPIWSNMTEVEDKLIAKILIQRGRKSAATATVIRSMVQFADYRQLLIILGPRAWETGKAIHDEPPLPKRKRSLFRTVEGTAHEA